MSFLYDAEDDSAVGLILTNGYNDKFHQLQDLALAIPHTAPFYPHVLFMLLVATTRWEPGRLDTILDGLTTDQIIKGKDDYKGIVMHMTTHRSKWRRYAMPTQAPRSEMIESLELVHAYVKKHRGGKYDGEKVDTYFNGLIHAARTGFSSHSDRAPRFISKGDEGGSWYGLDEMLNLKET